MRSVRRGERLSSLLVALVAVSVAQEATPLTLAEAAQMTLANNPMHKAALADTKASLAGVGEARAPMLPRIMFTENFTAGNDPVFVFGTKLRQQEFTAARLCAESIEPSNANRQLRHPLFRTVEPLR